MDADRVLLPNWLIWNVAVPLAQGACWWSFWTRVHLRSLEGKETHCRALRLWLTQWCFPTHNNYIYIYTHMYMYMHMYLYVYMYICICKCICKCICICIYIYVCIYLYMVPRWFRPPMLAVILSFFFQDSLCASCLHYSNEKQIRIFYLFLMLPYILF